MKRHFYILFGFLPAIMLFSCTESWLEVRSRGSLDQYTLSNEKGIEALLVGAYSLLDGVSSQFGWEAASSNWLYGSIRGGEANKGTDAGDAPGGINSILTYTETSTNEYLYVKWKQVYEAVNRCNKTIILINAALKEGNITPEKADLFMKQARTLRGWYHFEAWRMWRNIPYIDERTDTDTVTNRGDPRPKIIADLQEGISLPDNMGAVGRFNRTVARVLLAKAKMQMYNDWTGALALLEAAKNGTKPNGDPIGLAPTYGEIFDITNRNGIEAIYTVQYSVNDGSGGWNGGWGEVLNFPYKPGGSPAGCCGFYQPTQEFVNSFRTIGGLPMLDHSYNNAGNFDYRDFGVQGGDKWNPDYSYSKSGYYIRSTCTAYSAGAPFTDLGYKSLIDDNKGNDPLTSPAAWELIWTEDNSRPVDPRLDWTIGRRGIPYWDWGVHTGSDWIRDQTYAGPYSPKKHSYKRIDEGKYTELSGWTGGWTANGYRMIRYADLLLLLAECQIETGAMESARTNINLIRARAANPAGFVKESDGITNAANYSITTYPETGYPFDSQENARLALRMERKLELGMEGHRWFDLNRWGITMNEMNRIFTFEKSTPWGMSMYGWALAGPEDVVYPIPQREIDKTNGRLKQNR